MDGLECSEIMAKEIDHALFRIEAEYYQKKFRQAQQMLSQYATLEQYAKKIECGPFGSNLLDTEYTDSGILVVRPFNLVNCSIEKDRLVHIPLETLQRNGLKSYGKGTVLFSRVGDIKVGYANRDRFTISPNIIVMDCGDDIQAKYIALFFNTPYGSIQIQRQLKVAAQPTISTEVISKLKIPNFSALMPLVARYMSEAERCLDSANRAYSQAESVLKKRLGVMNRLQGGQKVSTKRLSESYALTGRLDAEYYQPKYDQLFKTLTAFTNSPLGGPDGIADFQKSIEPGSESYGEEGIPFVRVSDVTKFGVSEPEIKLPTDIVEHPETLFPKKILFCSLKMVVLELLISWKKTLNLLLPALCFI